MNDENTSEAVVVRDGMTLEQRIRGADELMQAIMGIRSQALKYTRPGDWTDQSGVPYLSSSACLLIANPYGISITDIIQEPVEIIEHEDGTKERIYTVRGYVSISGLGKIPAMGTASTHDDLLGKKDGEYKPLSRINVPAIKKKALTNLYGRAIRSLLNLNGLTWGEFEELTGYKRAQVAGKVTRRGESKKNKELSDEAKAKLAEIESMLDYCFPDTEGAKAWLLNTTTFTVKDTGEVKKGVRNTGDLSEARIVKVVYPKLMDLYSRMYESENGPGPGAEK